MTQAASGSRARIRGSDYLDSIGRREGKEGGDILLPALRRLYRCFLGLGLVNQVGLREGFRVDELCIHHHQRPRRVRMGLEFPRAPKVIAARLQTPVDRFDRPQSARVQSQTPLPISNNVAQSVEGRGSTTQTVSRGIFFNKQENRNTKRERKT